ncbi:MAG: Gfo/Idh/MocA family oxidoreductase [Verrucomicrobia bacterium]|jgi:predicted dehydrogenase|nr:Gfo/Idh/MocA family oxidoreductase [Verrucomicrobiota bacterium]
MENPIPSLLSRRDFITKSAAGAGLLLGAAPSILKAREAAAPGQDIRVAFIGCGKQQEVLFNAMVNIPGVRYVACCDIMKARLQRAVGTIYRRFDYKPNQYFDAAEMLEKEAGNLDAVFVATPDFWHSPHTIMALDAGYHVYCEKMMAHTIEDARAMVAAMDRSGKLCQIGHQRRSNPRYQFVLNELLRNHQIFGRIINMNGQWNRALSASQDIVSRPAILPDAETLRRYGFNNGTDKKLSEDELRHRFLNWRFYTALSGGPISDLGAHQIDIFNWFLGTQPKSVMASGGRSYFKDREHFDNVMCIFDYDTPEGNARAFYQVLTTTSAGGGYYETFMGTEGSLEMSEREAFTNIYKEAAANNEDKWNDMVRRGYLKKEAAWAPTGGDDDAIASYESAPPDKYALPGGLNKPPHQPHIENFFDSIRGDANLTCDARHALESEAPIYWVNPAAENNQTIQFTEEHLHT